MSWSWFRWHIVVKSSWQYIVFISYALFVEEASFYWHFRRGGPILFNSFFQNYAGCWLEFHFMFHALPGLVVLIKFYIGVAQYAQIKRFCHVESEIGLIFGFSGLWPLCCPNSPQFLSVFGKMQCLLGRQIVQNIHPVCLCTLII